MAGSLRYIEGSSGNPEGKDQEERFKRLIWPLAAVVLRSARYLTRHDQEAEDLAQDTLIKAFRAMHSYSDGTNVKAWLITILRRTHIDRGRAAQRRAKTVSARPEFEPDGDLSEVPTPGELDKRWTEPESMLDQFEDGAVIEALRSLPDDIRWTLLLVDIEQLDQVTTAELLEVPVGTIKSRAYRGRAMLRDRLYRVARERGWLSEPVSRESLYSDE